jgi:hypothetical protein
MMLPLSKAAIFGRRGLCGKLRFAIDHEVEM